MRFVSTRGQSPSVSLSEALLRALAPDGGLYVPSWVPTVDVPRAPLPEVATAMLRPFVGQDPLRDVLPALVAATWTFPAVVAPVGDDVHLVELFHGPTGAFKDYAARFLAAAVAALPDAAGSTVLVATSGDTGAAVAAAFHGAPGVRVVVLHPRGRVSPRQAHHLGAFGGNVVSCAVDGDFDACQALVRRALSAPPPGARWLSANSLSLGRWLPQIVVAAQVAATADGPVDLCVPTGNLGNATAAVLARAMGAPIRRVLLAANANRTLVDGFRVRQFRPGRTVATLANAMDVADPSNLARLCWLHPEPWDADILVDSVDDAAIRARIRAEWARSGRAVCPHTAVALEAVARRRAAGDDARWLVYATAHPAKFPEVVEPLIGAEVAPPRALAEAWSGPARHVDLPATDAALRAVLG